MSNGTLINFDFYFLPSEDPNIVTQEINLQEFGKLTFEIDVGSSYGQLITENYISVIDNFLDKYSIDSVYLGKNQRCFQLEDYKELSQRIEDLRFQIQDKGYISSDTYKDLEDKVSALSDFVKDLDKDIAIKQEKQAQIYIQIERLDEMIKDIKTTSTTKEDKKKDVVEKILLLIIGAIISFVFNRL